jgi:hypothetical protein
MNVTPKRSSFFVAINIFFFFCLSLKGQEMLVRGGPVGYQFGIYELDFHTSDKKKDPFYELELKVIFTLPSGVEVTVDGFNDGGALFKARAYGKEVGKWTWRSRSNDTDMDGHSGSFEILPSTFRGKLKVHPEDPYQFAYANGDWFLHIGDTGYRFVVASEPHWKDYIDQAALMGATKIRTWFAMERSKVSDLFEGTTDILALNYWKEIERRIIYTLEKHPHIVLQLIPYAEDAPLINSYTEGSRKAQKIAQYAQARWSSFPNVQWTIVNDMILVDNKAALKGREVNWQTIDQMGKDMAAREPWETLLTSHQSRFSGYHFVDAPWSDLVTLEDLDEVAGQKILEYRQRIKQPIVNDEDRYELYRPAVHRRYFFRRLMWASLFSGGHATYGGLRTYEAHGGHNIGPTGEMSNDYLAWEGLDKGVSGYFDANKAGMLQQGAHDFRHIHYFFKSSGLTLVGLEPDDTFAGGEPFKAKCIQGNGMYLIYLANPSGEKPETDFPATQAAEVTINLPNGSYTCNWFDPKSGTWIRGSMLKGGEQLLKAPAGEDWVVWIAEKR